MQAPDPVETILARLMPPALGQERQEKIGAMLDELAANEPANVTEISSGRWLARCLVGGGIAAAIGALIALYPDGRPLEKPRLSSAPVSELSSGLILVSESDRIESMTDEGLRQNADGSTVRAVRLQAVEKNRVLDEESGIEVEISEPREEILLTPVSDF